MKILLVSPEFAEDVLSGKLTATVRKGYKEYWGTIALGCHIANWCELAKVMETKECILYNITSGDLKYLNLNSLGELLTLLKKYYGPDIDGNTEITYIRWKLFGSEADCKKKIEFFKEYMKDE